MKSIALIGNPNSGKSTLFNSLTGSTQFVGNWPGVTVEKKGGKTKIGNEKVEVMDTPGIYSLSSYSPEEVITRDYVLNEKPDVVVNIIDASNLERNLYLTTQILELNVPTIIALNMIDVIAKKGEVISAKALSKELGCPVCEISAISNKGIPELKNTIAEVLKKEDPEAPQHSFRYSDDVESAIKAVSDKLVAENAVINVGSYDFTALKMLSGDKQAVKANKIDSSAWEEAAKLREEVEKKADDDFESVIAEQRYTWIGSIINSVITKRRTEKLSLSDKIDRVLTNRIAALPIFLAIIYGIYWMCLNPHGLGKKLVGITFGWVFQFLFWVMGIMTEAGCWPWLTDLVCNGMIFGIGIVIAFVPYLMVLFFFLALLEECGYMARVTFIMDRIFRRFGLSGKSFIPMLLGTGCTVQAVAAARTIENENDRKMTIFLTPFMPCATKMPTVLLVVSLFAGSSALVAPLVYIFAILFIILGGIILKHTAFKGDPAPFVMELPEYKLPTPKGVWHFIWDRTKSFFRKVTSIIFVSTVVIWFFKYFGFEAINGAAVGAANIESFAAFGHVPNIENSLLADIGRLLAPIFAPLGFGDWRLVAAMITGYVAKDNVLATLGIIFGVEAVDAAIMGTVLNPAQAVGFLLFFLLSSPCFASIGAMSKELGSKKLTWGAVAFQCGTAYVVSLIVYQILHLVM